MSLRRPLTGLATELWLPLTLLGVWWVVSSGSTSPLYPSLETILTTAWDQTAHGPIPANLAYSLVNLAYGLGIGIVVGVGVGLVIGANDLLFRTMEPLLQFMRAIPKVALVPLLVLALGIDRAPKIAIIALACVWPILLNAVDGMRGVDPLLKDVGRSYRLPRMLRVRRLLLPAVSPQVVAGIRISLSLGLIIVVVSEMYAATEGIGYYILQSGQSFQVPETWAGTLVLGLVGYLLNLAFTLCERHYLGWHFAASNEGKG